MGYLAYSRLHTSVGLPIPISAIGFLGFLYKHTRQPLVWLVDLIRCFNVTKYCKTYSLISPYLGLQSLVSGIARFAKPNFTQSMEYYSSDSINY